MATYLGLDLGTTAAKGVILGDDGSTLARARVPHRLTGDAGSRRVHPATWAASIAEVCAQLRPHLAGISAIGIAAHCPVMVPLDATGRAVGAAVPWTEPLLAAQLAQRSQRRSAASIAATGNHPSASTTAALAYHYLRLADPDAFAAMRTLGFVGSWLGAQLTGVIAADPTQASYTGVFDVLGEVGRWLPDAMDELELDPAVLPPVRGCAAVLGTTDTDFCAALGLPTGVPVVVGSADTPAAAHALGYAPLLSLGTTHVVAGAQASPDLRRLVLQRRGIRDGQWLVNGVTNGGLALAHAAQLAGQADVGALIQLATGDSGAVPTTPIFVPHVTAERGPFWLDEPVSAVVGATSQTSPGQLASALVNGVVFADRLVLEATLPASDLPLLLTGAYGDDLALPQRISDLCSRPLLVTSEPDLPAIGVAMLAAEAVHGSVPDFGPATQLVEPGRSSELVEPAWAAFRSTWAERTGLDPTALLHRTDSTPERPAQ